MEPPTDASEAVRRKPDAPTARPGPVVLAAVLTELVIIGALGNQWLTERAAQWILNENQSALAGDFKIALITYNWRFTPLSDDRQHTWLSQVLMIAATVMLTAAFTSVVVRGPATFGRTFLATTMSALTAATLAMYVRALVNNQPLIPGSRLEKTLFSAPLSPNAISMFAALVLAVTAGLAAAVVANMLGERAVSAPADAAPAAEPAYVAPEQPPPFFPDPPRTRPSPTGFPRPPDDEDLGHVHE